MSAGRRKTGKRENKNLQRHVNAGICEGLKMKTNPCGLQLKQTVLVCAYSSVVVIKPVLMA